MKKRAAKIQYAHLLREKEKGIRNGTSTSDARGNIPSWYW